jgi:hypothetical protein
MGCNPAQLVPVGPNGDGPRRLQKAGARSQQFVQVVLQLEKQMTATFAIG